jgi:anti-sigma B factor antagonist
VQLVLTGELDLAAAPALEGRLERLRAEKLPIRLDLSKLDFIDSTGIGSLLRAVTDARRNERRLEVEPELTPAVRRALKLAQLEALILGTAAQADQTSH